jgi:hypothetical protein
MIRKAWVNTQKRRFYRVTLFRDLLGNCEVFRVWGCLDSHQSCSLHRLMPSYNEGLKLIRELDQRRLRSGYRVTEFEREEDNGGSLTPPLPLFKQLSLPLPGLQLH